MIKTGQKLSIIVPFYNEAENAKWVLFEIKELHPEAEIIAVNDGSTDRTLDEIKKVDGVKLLSSSENLGQSVAFYNGMQEALGEIVVLMDGDGQNDPKDIERLLENLREDNCVCGYRKNRQDKIERKIAGVLGNVIRKIVLGNDGIRDAGCSLKTFYKKHVINLSLFDGMHRYIPTFFHQANIKMVEIPVNHKPRKFGISKYTTFGRTIRGLSNLLYMRKIMKEKQGIIRKPLCMKKS